MLSILINKRFHRHKGPRVFLEFLKKELFKMVIPIHDLNVWYDNLRTEKVVWKTYLQRFTIRGFFSVCTNWDLLS